MQGWKKPEFMRFFTRGFFLYCVSFLAAGLISFGFMHSARVVDVNSARYLLSSIVQSQAAVISIVVTLTLVAVQLTSTTYSSRVIDIFKRHPSMWHLIFFYIFSMILTAATLGRLTGNDFIQHDYILFLTYFVVIIFLILLLAIVPYIRDTLTFLKSSTLLESLADLIGDEEIDEKVDPFQSIFDIIYGSIRNSDFTTMNAGLAVVHAKYADLLQKNPAQHYVTYISSKYFEDLQRVAIQLLNYGEEGTALQIIKYFESDAMESFQSGNIDVLGTIVTAVGKVGKYAAENKSEAVVHECISVTSLIARKIARIGDSGKLEEMEVVFFGCVHAIGTIELVSLSNYAGPVKVRYGIDVIEDLCLFASEQDLIFSAAISMIENLVSIAYRAAELQNMFILNRVISALRKICISNIARHETQNRAALAAIGDIRDIALYASANNAVFPAARPIHSALFSIAEKAHEKGFPAAVEKALAGIAELKVLYPDVFTAFDVPPVAEHGAGEAREVRAGLHYTTAVENERERFRKYIHGKTRQEQGDGETGSPE